MNLPLDIEASGEVIETAPPGHESDPQAVSEAQGVQLKISQLVNELAALRGQPNLPPEVAAHLEVIIPHLTTMSANLGTAISTQSPVLTKLTSEVNNYINMHYGEIMASVAQADKSGDKKTAEIAAHALAAHAASVAQTHSFMMDHVKGFSDLSDYAQQQIALQTNDIIEADPEFSKLKKVVTVIDGNPAYKAASKESLAEAEEAYQKLLELAREKGDKELEKQLLELHKNFETEKPAWLIDAWKQYEQDGNFDTLKTAAMQKTQATTQAVDDMTEKVFERMSQEHKNILTQALGGKEATGENLRALLEEMERSGELNKDSINAAYDSLKKANGNIEALSPQEQKIIAASQLKFAQEATKSLYVLGTHIDKIKEKLGPEQAKQFEQEITQALDGGNISDVLGAIGHYSPESAEGLKKVLSGPEATAALQLMGANLDGEGVKEILSAMAKGEDYKTLAKIWTDHAGSDIPPLDLSNSNNLRALGYMMAAKAYGSEGAIQSWSADEFKLQNFLAGMEGLTGATSLMTDNRQKSTASWEGLKAIAERADNQELLAYLDTMDKRLGKENLPWLENVAGTARFTEGKLDAQTAAREAMDVLNQKNKEWEVTHATIHMKAFEHIPDTQQAVIRTALEKKGRELSGEALIQLVDEITPRLTSENVNAALKRLDAGNPEKDDELLVSVAAQKLNVDMGKTVYGFATYLNQLETYHPEKYKQTMADIQTFLKTDNAAELVRVYRESGIPGAADLSPEKARIFEIIAEMGPEQGLKAIQVAKEAAAEKDPQAQAEKFEEIVNQVTERIKAERAKHSPSQEADSSATGATVDFSDQRVHSQVMKDLLNYTYASPSAEQELGFFAGLNNDLDEVMAALGLGSQDDSPEADASQAVSPANTPAAKGSAATVSGNYVA